MDDPETLHRRARLRELITVCFDDLDKNLLDYIHMRTGKRPNQGELSSLQQDHGKSFGDKKARTFTEQIGLHRRWFEFPMGVHLDQTDWMKPYSDGEGIEEPPHPYNALQASPVRWPFPEASEDKFNSLTTKEKQWVGLGLAKLILEAEGMFPNSADKKGKKISSRAASFCRRS